MLRSIFFLRSHWINLMKERYRLDSSVHKMSTTINSTNAIFSVQIEPIKTLRMIIKPVGKYAAFNIFLRPHSADSMKERLLVKDASKHFKPLRARFNYNLLSFNR